MPDCALLLHEQAIRLSFSLATCMRRASIIVSGQKTDEEIRQENILRQAWDMEGSPFKGQPFDPNVLKPQSFGQDFPCHPP